jgi:adenylate kinase
MSRPPIRWIALTGTPGVGKTSLARALREEAVSVVDGKRFANAHGCVVGYDRFRRSRIVDVRRVGAALRRMAPSDEVRLLESHWAHEVPGVDAAIVLRVHPATLARRLARRRYPRAKVRENLEAEAIDLIVQECVRRFGKRRVAQLDATRATTGALARKVQRILADPAANLMKFEISPHDWTQELLRWS